MLSLLYSEILKMLRLWGLLDFDVEIFYPHDLNSLPRLYNKQRSKESDQPHILTVQALLVEARFFFSFACEILFHLIIFFFLDKFVLFIQYIKV